MNKEDLLKYFDDGLTYYHVSELADLSMIAQNYFSITLDGDHYIAVSNPIIATGYTEIV